MRARIRYSVKLFNYLVSELLFYSQVTSGDISLTITIFADIISTVSKFVDADC